MSLELKVSADDVKSLFTEDRELLKAALRDKDTGIGGNYPPNLHVTPLTVMKYLRFGTVPNYLKSAIGFDEGLYESRIVTTADTWCSLVASLEGEHATNLDDLIQQHVSQLRWFEGLYTQLSGLNAAELPDGVADPINRGLNGFRVLITRSNMMYNPKTRAEFLQHVHESVVEKDYEQRLLQQEAVTGLPAQ